MATRVKRSSKIGKAISKAAKKKNLDLGIGPGAIVKGAGSVAKGLAAIRDRLRKKASQKATPLKGPDTRTLAQRRGLVGDLTKTPKSELSAADQVRRKTQLSSKAMKEGAKEMAKKVPRKKQMIKVSVKGPISHTITDAGSKAAVAARKAKRRTEVADLIRKSNAQADRLAGKAKPRTPTTGLPARQSSGSGFNPRQAAEARKTPAKRAREARLRNNR